MAALKKHGAVLVSLWNPKGDLTIMRTDDEDGDLKRE